MVNFEDEEDRISALPDCLIQYILSLLPTTRESIRTSIISKGWQNQWTHVPVLIFDSDSDSTGMSNESYLRLIEYTLIAHDCSKIKKFHLEYDNKNGKADYHYFYGKIRFAVRKHVEELYLSSLKQQLLPTFLFSYDSLVELITFGFTFMPNIRKFNWGSLTTLQMSYCDLYDDEMIEHILSGSPSLESLTLTHSVFDFDNLVIASKSLKRLDLGTLHIYRIEISCSNLEKFSFIAITILDGGSDLFARAIEKVLSNSLLLESFDLRLCMGSFDQINKLVISSKSVKRLVLGNLQTTDAAAALEISCPNLEKLKLLDSLKFGTVKLLNFPSSLRATIDVYIPSEELQIHMELLSYILQSLQLVEHLEIGTSFFEVLSDLELKGGLVLPMLNIKSLILNSFDLNKHPYEIASLLRNSLVLEKLVIKGSHYPTLLPAWDRHSEYYESNDYCEKLNEFGENYWNSNATIFDCLVSHLKTIEIIGFPHRDDNRKLVLNFVQFLLKNARVLEKMVVRLKDEKAFMLKVFQELSSLQRYSRNAIIKCCQDIFNKFSDDDSSEGDLKQQITYIST